MPPNDTFKSVEPRFKEIKSVVDRPPKVKPSAGEENVIYVAEDGTDMQFWDSRNQRYQSTQQKGGDRFLLSTEKTDAFFEYDGEFNNREIKNRIDDKETMELKGVPPEKRLKDSIRAYYSFDTDNGGKNDEIHSFDGTLKNNAEIVSGSGKIGSGLHITAGADKMEIGRALDVRDGDFSVSLWFRPSTMPGGDTPIFASNSDATSSPYFSVVLLASGKLQIVFNDGTETTQDGSTTLHAGHWYHIVLTRTGQTGTLYVNGSQETNNSSLAGGELTQASDTGTIGTLLTDDDIDEFGVWTRVLDADEVSYLFHARPPGYYLSLPSSKIRAYYSFDTQTGTEDQIHSFDGTLNNNAVIDPELGKDGSGLKIRSENDYMKIGRALEVTDGDFTVSLWLRVSSLPGSEKLIFSSDIDGTTTPHFSLGLKSNGELKATLEDNTNTATFSSSTTLQTGHWYHIALTRTGAKGVLYVNGDKDTTDSNLRDGDVTGTGITSTIGTTLPDGDIDDFAIWTRVLSSTDVSELFQSQKVSDYMSLPSSPLVTSDVSSELRSYYTFDEPGGVMEDVTGQNNGGLSGASQTDPQIWGHALTMSGSNEGATINQALAFGSQVPFTVALWVYIESVGSDYTILAQGNVSNPDAKTWALQSIDDGSDSQSFKVVMYDTGSNESSVTTNTTYIKNEWHHVVVTRSSDGTTKIYVNGSEDTPASSNLTTDALDNGTSEIGGVTNAGALVGDVDEVAVWTVNLPESDIKTLYNQAIPGTRGFLTYRNLANNVRAHYRLDGNTNDALDTNNGSGFQGHYVEGIIAKGAQFNGSTSIDVDDAFRTPSIDFSISFWVNFADVKTDQTLIKADADDGSNGWNVTLQSTSSNIRFTTVSSGVNVDHGSSLSTGTWYFVVISREDDKVTIRIRTGDGTTIGTDKTDDGNIDSGSLRQTKNPSLIGDSSVVNGTVIDEVTMFERPLVSQDVDALVNNGNGLPFDEFKQWNFLRDSSGMLVNAFGQVQNSYLQYKGDVSTFRDYTVSTWMKPQTFFHGKSNPAYIMWIGDTNVNSLEAKNGYVAYDHMSNTVTINQNQTNHTASLTLNTGTWYHFVLTRDNSKGKLALFVNNAKILESDGLEGISSGGTLRIGGGYTDSDGDVRGTLEALVDQTSVFNQVLPQKYVDILWNNGLGMDIKTQVTKIASLVDVGATEEYADAGDYMLHKINAYYSFDHISNKDEGDYPEEDIKNWERDDVGNNDGTADPNLRFDGVSIGFTKSQTNAKLGNQSLKSPADESAVQKFIVGTGDPPQTAVGMLAQQNNIASYSMWFRTPDNTASEYTFYTTDHENQSLSFTIRQNEARIKVFDGDTEKLSSRDFIRNDTWHHILWTIDTTASESKLYIDGDQEDSYQPSEANGNVNNGAFIDPASATPQFLIDEFGTWQRVLDTGDVNYLYREGSGINRFINQLWHEYPAQQDVVMKNHRLREVRDPTKSTDASTKGFSLAADNILNNLQSYFVLDDDLSNQVGTEQGTANGTSTTSGIIGDGRSFESGDNIGVGSAFHLTDSITGRNPPFSISFWFKPQNVSAEQILVQNHTDFNSTTQNSSRHFLVRLTSTGNIEYEEDDGSNSATVTGATSLGGAWYHICVIRDPNAPFVRIYLDDHLDKEESNSSNLATGRVEAIRSDLPRWQFPPSEGSISDANTSIQSDGAMDELGFWNRALDDHEIRYLYNDGNATNEFIYGLWYTLVPRSSVDFNGNSLQQIGAPSAPSDAARLQDITKWRSGNLNVRQTVANGHVDFNGRANKLGQTVDSTTVTTALRDNNLADKIQSFYDFDDFSSGGSVTNRVDGTTANVTGSTADNSVAIRGSSIKMQGNSGDEVDLGNQLNFGTNDFSLSLYVQFGDQPTAKQTFLTDDATNHLSSGDLDTTKNSAFALVYDQDNGNGNTDGAYVFEMLEGSNSIQRAIVDLPTSESTNWNLVQVTRKDDKVTLYVNGRPNTVTLNSSSGNIANGTDGRLLSKNASDGKDIFVDLLGIWNTALDQESLRAMAEHPLLDSIQSFVNFDSTPVADQSANGALPVVDGSTGSPTVAQKDAKLGHFEFLDNMDNLRNSGRDPRDAIINDSSTIANAPGHYSGNGGAVEITTEAIKVPFFPSDAYSWELVFWFKIPSTATDNNIEGTQLVEAADFNVSNSFVLLKLNSPDSGNSGEFNLALEYPDNGGLFPSIFLANAISKGTWHFVSIRAQPGSNALRLLVDNSLENAISDWNGKSVNKAVIGSDFGGSGDSVHFEELAIYDRILSSSEIDSLWNNGSGQSFNNVTTERDPLRALYAFEDSSALGKDSKGNFDGTLGNGGANLSQEPGKYANALQTTGEVIEIPSSPRAIPPGPQFGIVFWLYVPNPADHGGGDSDVEGLTILNTDIDNSDSNLQIRITAVSDSASFDYGLEVEYDSASTIVGMASINKDTWHLVALAGVEDNNQHRLELFASDSSGLGVRSIATTTSWSGTVNAGGKGTIGNSNIPSSIPIKYEYVAIYDTSLVKDDDLINLYNSDNGKSPLGSIPTFEITSGGPAVRNESYKKAMSDTNLLYKFGSTFPTQNAYGAWTGWFFLNSTDRDVVLGETTENPNTALRLEQIGQNIRLGVYDASSSAYSATTETTNSPVTANQWVFVGINVDPDDNSTLYVDGEKVGSVTTPSFGTSSSEGFRVMEQLSTNDHLDITAVWMDRILSDWEMNMVYNVNTGVTWNMVADTSNNRNLAPRFPDDFSLSRTSHFTFADGFEEGTQLNHGVSTTNFLEWNLGSSLSTNAKYYLYVEYDENTQALTTGSTEVAPTYSFQRPVNPTSGTYWYPIDHRQRGEYYDGSSWNKVLRVYVGEAHTNGSGVVTDVYTYAYQGRYVSDAQQGIEDGGALVYTHNMGTHLLDIQYIARFNTAAEGYDVGDEIVFSGTHNNAFVTHNRANRRQSVFAMRDTGLGNFTKASGGAASTDPSWSEFDIFCRVQRAF